MIAVKKPREMVTGPEAFENFKRLMTALLVVPKHKVMDKKPVKRRAVKKAASKRNS